MGLFSKLFGDSKEVIETNVLPWILLNDLHQLDNIEEKSKTKTQVIFKHSTRCGISKMVINSFTSDYKLNENELDLYYLDLLGYREVSDVIEHKFKVIHESPQLLIIKNGIVVVHASHGEISNIDLKAFV